MGDSRYDVEFLKLDNARLRLDNERLELDNARLHDSRVALSARVAELEVRPLRQREPRSRSGARAPCFARPSLARTLDSRSVS
jgi:hypothetical protein